MRLLFAMCLALAAPAAPAAAVDIEKEATETVLWAAVAARSLNVRAEPSMQAAAEFQLPRGAYVAIVEALGQPARIDGQEDTWTLIATETCVTQNCTLLRGGWVADSWLAYQERFEKMSEWREGEITGSDGERDFVYRIAADASFEFVTAPCEAEGCEEYQEYEGCREEDYREGDECVGRGDLYRYRDLVWARGYGYLSVDAKDNLCSVFSGRDGAPRMCDQ